MSNDQICLLQSLTLQNGNSLIISILFVKLNDYYANFQLLNSKGHTIGIFKYYSSHFSFDFNGGMALLQNGSVVVVLKKNDIYPTLNMSFIYLIFDENLNLLVEGMNASNITQQ